MEAYTFTQQDYQSVNNALKTIAEGTAIYYGDEEYINIEEELTLPSGDVILITGNMCVSEKPQYCSTDRGMQTWGENEYSVSKINIQIYNDDIEIEVKYDEKLFN